MHHESESPTGADARKRGDVRPGVERVAGATAPREVCVVVDGELDVATVPRLLELTRAALEADAPVVVLDLSGVEFVDCSGLRGLVTARALLLAAGRVVTVPLPSPAITRLLSWTSMTEHFAPVPTTRP